VDQVYEELLHLMEFALDKLVSQVPAPQPAPFGPNRFVFRYMERTAQQAIVQKLARIITGLRAAHFLLEQGLLQEQAVIERVIDEFHEDVLFLSYGILKGETKNHKSFLTGFYEEEFDNAASAFDSTQKRPTVSRDKIRAYLARIEGISGNPSDNQEQLRTLFKAFSGFVHGASPQIMDMYIGDPPHFHVRGMLGTVRMAEYQIDIWNYFFRGIMAFGYAAKAFGDEELFQGILVQKRNFERQSGRGE
jgi:hypothetical protein